MAIPLKIFDGGALVRIAILLMIVAGTWQWATKIDDPSWTDSNVKTTQQNGETIVAGLGRYQANHGKYPAKLEDLVPSDISVIPQPIAGGGHWEYSVSDSGKSFNLSFYSEEPVARSFDWLPNDKAWLYHEPHF